MEYGGGTYSISLSYSDIALNQNAQWEEATLYELYWRNRSMKRFNVKCACWALFFLKWNRGKPHYIRDTFTRFFPITETSRTVPVTYRNKDRTTHFCAWSNTKKRNSWILRHTATRQRPHSSPSATCSETEPPISNNDSLHRNTTNISFLFGNLLTLFLTRGAVPWVVGYPSGYGRGETNSDVGARLGHLMGGRGSLRAGGVIRGFSLVTGAR